MKICLIFPLSRLKNASAQANKQKGPDYITHRKLTHRYELLAASYILVLSIIPLVQISN